MMYLVRAGSNVALDSIQFDSIKLPLSSSLGYGRYLVEVDSNNQVKRARYIGMGGDAHLMTSDGEGNTYLAGRMNNSDSIWGIFRELTDGVAWYMKLDSAWDVVWFKQLEINAVYPPGALYHSQNNALYFVLEARDTARIADSVYFLHPNTTSSIYGEINPQNGAIIWSHVLRINQQDDLLSLTGIVPLDSHLYLSGQFRQYWSTTSSSIDTAYIQNDTLWGPGGFIVQCDPMGNYQHSAPFYLKNHPSNKNVLVTGLKKMRLLPEEA